MPFLIPFYSVIFSFRLTSFVGPKKTATRNIQQFLGQNENATKLLDEDNVKVYTRFNAVNNEIWDDVFQLLWRCKHNMSKTTLDDFMTTSCFDANVEPAWTRFQNEMKYQSDELGNSIFLSEENIYGCPGFEINVKRLADTFHLYSTNFKQVNVVVTYRRYFEWILSLYNQENKLSHWRIENVYSNEIFESNSFVNWYRNIAPNTGISEREVVSESSVEFLRDTFSPQNVHVFNMHDESESSDNGIGNRQTEQRGGVVGRFICTEIQQAKGLCTAIQSGEFPELEQVTNARNGLLDSQYIVHRAIMDMMESTKRNSSNNNRTSERPFVWGGGKLPSNRQINYAVLELAPQVEEFKQARVAQNVTSDTGNTTDSANTKTSKDGIPLELLTSSELDDILQRSIELERFLVPEYHSSSNEDEGETALRKIFQEFVNDQKFCSIDYDRLMDEQQEWRRFVYELLYDYAQSHEGEGREPST